MRGRSDQRGRTGRSGKGRLPAVPVPAEDSSPPNTMALALTFLGLSPMGLNDIPAVDPRKAVAARRAGELVVEALREGRNARQLITPVSLKNAAAAVSATAGSTNAVLHLVAIATRVAGIGPDGFSIR